MVEHYTAAAELANRPTPAYGMAALGAAYAGDLVRARRLNARQQEMAVSPGMRAIGAYVDGEIENSTGRPERAEQHYTTAIDLARTAGATFVVGVASVGLLTALTAAGRGQDALRGYRELVDYWARAGNWTHQWVTLRNLGQLLRTLGDDGAADLLETAADHAPDAPAVSAAVLSPRVSSTSTRLSHERVLDVARQAIDRNLYGV